MKRENIMTEKYGLVITHTDNLGDEIQSIAVKRFLPSVDYYLDRDKINSAATPTAESIRAVLNGWWCHSPENWPPFSALVPLFVSFHLSPFRSPSLGLIPSEIFTAEPVANYLRTSGPVGARDLGTLDILRKAKIECYFSGCMTLTLERRDTEREGDLIVLNDVPDEVAKLFKSRTRKRVVRTQHAGHAQKAMKERFEQAERMLELYSSASCVITTRLHCALPCVAMETPLLLLDTAEDPKRFACLSDFMHHLSIHEIASSASAYDLDRPPSNPG